jgi:hypothetical protein
MAKQSDRSAGAPKIDKTGSPLSGLFADENEFDRRALWRIGTWGVAAVGAVTLAVMSNQWSLGFRREQVAAADLARQAQQIQSLAKESQNETRRLASAIETLNSDRDRLFSRVTVIEQGLDSVTGALAKQPTPSPVASTAPQASATAQASNTPSVTPPAPQQNAAAARPAVAAPAPSPVATITPAVPDKPRAEAGKTDASTAAAAINATAAPNAGPATTASASPPPDSAAAGASLMARSMMGPPEPAAPRLIEALKPEDAKVSDVQPADAKAADMKTAEANVDAKIDSKPPAAASAASSEVVASATPVDEPEAEIANVAVKRTDFAVDLGSANSLGGLRALWRGVRHFNAELRALSPIVVIREGQTGLGMQLHLAAGPLKDAAAAAKICAALVETKRACETTVYDGQRLVMKADEAQSLSTIKAAGTEAKWDAKSDGKSETRPDTRADAKLEAKGDGKGDGKPDPKLDPKSGSSKRNWYRHAKKEEPPPPPPQPESTSAFSTLFGRK